MAGFGTGFVEEAEEGSSSTVEFVATTDRALPRLQMDLTQTNRLILGFADRPRDKE